ncbi:MAG: response regulator transcription factor [Prochlorococcaceae cyanobacterium]
MGISPLAASEGPTPFQTSHPAAQIWILDDDVALCELLAEQLSRAGWQLSSFHAPASFEAALSEQQPDLLVLDQMLPRKPGTQILAKLRQQGHSFPVLMLSALGAPTDRVHGLEVGANDYLAKPFLCRELQLRIEHLLAIAAAGVKELSPRTQGQGFRLASLLFNPNNQTLLTASEDVVALSRGDTALLEAFCKAPGLILSREQLAQASGSLVDASNSRSLDVRISKLRKLLSCACSGQELIESVRGRGYRLVIDAAIEAVAVPG